MFFIKSRRLAHECLSFSTQLGPSQSPPAEFYPNNNILLMVSSMSHKRRRQNHFSIRQNSTQAWLKYSVQHSSSYTSVYTPGVVWQTDQVWLPWIVEPQTRSQSIKKRLRVRPAKSKLIVRFILRFLSARLEEIGQRNIAKINPNIQLCNQTSIKLIFTNSWNPRNFYRDRDFSIQSDLSFGFLRKIDSLETMAFIVPHISARR